MTSIFKLFGVTGLPCQVCELVWVTVDPVPCTPQRHHSTANPCIYYSLPPQVCELIWVTVDPASCTPNPAMQQLAADLVRAIMELRPRFTTALRVAQAGVLSVFVCASMGGAGGWGHACRAGRRTLQGRLPLTPRHPPVFILIKPAEEEGRAAADDDVADEFDDDFDSIKGMGRLFCEVSGHHYVSTVHYVKPARRTWGR